MSSKLWRRANAENENILKQPPIRLSNGIGRSILNYAASLWTRKRKILRQYLLSCHDSESNHPCNEIIQSDPPPCSITTTLFTQDLTTTGAGHITVKTNKYKIWLKNLHKDAVEKAIAIYKTNIVLGGKCKPTQTSNEDGKKLPS